MALFDSQSFVRALSPKMMIRAFKSFDRYTTTIVLSCWAIASVTILVALYAMWLVGTTKHEIAVAAMLEPGLPQITRETPTRDELKVLADRLQKQFNDLTIALGSDQTLNISTLDGNRYRSWIAAVSYVDAITPQYSWSIKEFCVGSDCSSDALMSAKLVAEKVSFAMPPSLR